MNGGQPDLTRMRRERAQKLLDQMEWHGIPTVLLLGQSNVQYATGAGVMSSDAGRAAHQRAVALLLAGDPVPHLFTPFPEGAPPDLPPDHLHAAAYPEFEQGAEALVSAAVDLIGTDQTTIAIDEYTAAVFEVFPRRFPSISVVDATPVTTTARLAKTADEIDCIHRAQHLNEQAMAEVQPLVRAGVRTAELTAAFLGRVFELGASANVVEPIWQVMPSSVASGPYSVTGEVVFPVPPADRVLAGGDVVWVDTGVAWHGYLSDFGRTWIAGPAEPDGRQHGQYQRWREVVDRVVEALGPGATGLDLVRAAESTGLARPWLPHLYLAHSTGTDSAELPFVGTDLGHQFDEMTVLSPGMVVVVEPVVWDDGHGGYRAEEIYAITEAGSEQLSSYSYEPYR